MTPTRSGSNYSIQSNESGPGHSGHKFKRQEFQPRGEAQMEDARTSTSSQRLASNFVTLKESPKAEKTAIPVFRPESFPAGNNRDIPVSVHELVYGVKAAGVGTSAKSLDRHNGLLSSCEDIHGSRKYRRISEGLDTHVLQGTSPTDTSLVEKPKNVVRGPEEEVGPRKGQQPSGSSPSSKSKNPPQQVPNKDKNTPKSNQKGKKKAKGKERSKWNKPYLQNYRIPKEEKTAMGNVFNMARTLMEFKNKEEERLNQSLPKK
ncbi:hypothetical protein O181_044679 [Austropuccinia psidii MF-1]|uniref:Uncharacterized protein n=1 Tax=Austropuccinia psidii MF-1 TaxID=1389203 RepID=A0A9Q3DKG8_9BASI|nr:hypothetical protein [Austropuccinia psidii MF-1]